MERLLMTYLRDLIHRLRLGQSQRQISRDLNVARETVHKYTLWAASVCLLNPGVPFPMMRPCRPCWALPPNLRAHLPVLGPTAR